MTSQIFHSGNFFCDFCVTIFDTKVAIFSATRFFGDAKVAFFSSDLTSRFFRRLVFARRRAGLAFPLVRMVVVTVTAVAVAAIAVSAARVLVAT
jgi:hypothetical protein